LQRTYKLTEVKKGRAVIELRRMAGPQLCPIQVELLEDVNHSSQRQVPFLGPHQDAQVFHPRLRPVENHFQKQVFFADQSSDQAEVFGSELPPTAAAGKMLQALQAAEQRPIPAIPVGQGPVSQIGAMLLALDPLVPLGFSQSLFVKAECLHGFHPPWQNALTPIQTSRTIANARRRDLTAACYL